MSKSLVTGVLAARCASVAIRASCRRLLVAMNEFSRSSDKNDDSVHATCSVKMCIRRHSATRTRSAMFGAVQYFERNATKRSVHSADIASATRSSTACSSGCGHFVVASSESTESARNRMWMRANVCVCSSTVAVFCGPSNVCVLLTGSRFGVRDRIYRKKVVFILLGLCLSLSLFQSFPLIILVFIHIRCLRLCCTERLRRLCAADTQCSDTCASQSQTSKTNNCTPLSLK